jgi:hypothetical protein
MHPNLRQAHKQRLYHLQVQAARMGYETPPHVLMEIEELEGLFKKKF